jgi:hypothetical protein
MLPYAPVLTRDNLSSILLRMEALPAIDDLTMRITATPEDAWRALLGTMRSQTAIELPRVLVRVWGLQEAKRVGEWRDVVSVGDSVLGFAVAAAQAPSSLTLRGSHRFSRYELRFELEPAGPEELVVHAKTSAEFPGVLGRIYRALVIGTGGHRFATRRMLSSIARRSRSTKTS